MNISCSTPVTRPSLNKPGDPPILVTVLLTEKEKRDLGFIPDWNFFRITEAPIDKNYFCFVCGQETQLLGGDLEGKVKLPFCYRHARDF